LDNRNYSKIDYNTLDMAELQALNWILEVRYFPQPYGRGGLRYEIFFRYKGEPIVRDGLLKRVPKVWEDRTPGAFLAHQQGACSLVPTLAQVLKTGENAFWQPEEPDITLAFYPGAVFPHIALDDSMTPSGTSRMHPDDLPIAVIAMIDSYNFGQEFAYQGLGPALILHVRRPVLEAFHDDLQAELEAFLEEYGPLGRPPSITLDL
jgi:hypothetical protein